MIDSVRGRNDRVVMWEHVHARNASWAFDFDNARQRQSFYNPDASGLFFAESKNFAIRCRSSVVDEDGGGRPLRVVKLPHDINELYVSAKRLLFNELS